MRKESNGASRREFLGAGTLAVAGGTAGVMGLGAGASAQGAGAKPAVTKIKTPLADATCTVQSRLPAP